MNRQLNEIHLRRGRLLERIAAQRADLERDLRPVRAYLEGEMRRAAEALHLTHSAVSQQIRLLEQRLGFALFLRQGRRLVLTDAGRHMLAASEAGAVIMPFSPGFYLNPQTLDDMLLHMCGRILDQVGLPHALGRWPG